MAFRRRVANAPVFQYASTQPFVDQAQQHAVTHPTSKKLSQVAVIQIVEELRMSTSSTKPPRQFINWFRKASNA